MVKAPKNPKKGTVATQSAPLSDLWPALLLVLVTLLVYSQCFDFEVTNWDDNHYIRELVLIRSLAWDNIVLMFKTKVLLSYNPLVVLSLAVDHALGNDSAGWYHGTNVVLHVCNSLLVFLVFRKLLQDRVGAWIIAFLFALHPMHVEAVAWIACRKDVLYTFFFMLSWYTYLRYSNHSTSRKWLWYAVSFLLFLASGFSKIQAVTMPVVLLLSDLLRQKTMDRNRFIDKLPFLAGALAFGGYAIGSSSLVADKYAVPVTLGTKIIYSFQAFTDYVVKAILPVNQMAIYAFPKPDNSMYMILLVSGVILFSAMVFFMIRWWKSKPLAAFGLAFFLINILPTLHVFALNSSLIYERFTYVSYLGVFLFLYAIPSMLRRPLPSWRWVMMLLIIPYSVMAYQRTLVWKGNSTLWSDIISKNPTCHEALNNRGAYYNETGDLEKAVADIDRSLALNPRQPRAYNNRSMIHFRQLKMDEALRDADSALALEPRLAEAWCNRGNVYFNRNQYDSAIVNYSRAFQFMANFPSNYTNRGSAYLKKGDFENARKDYEKAIEQYPAYADAYRLLALALAELNQPDQAVAAMQRSLELNPNSNAAMQLSEEFRQIGQRLWESDNSAIDSASVLYRKAISINDANVFAWYNLGGMHYLRKEIPEARDCWRKVLQYQPNDADAKVWMNRTGGM